MSYKLPAHLGVCVIVPTYNNANTLARILDGLAAMTSDIIIVNDGSTDGTSAILKRYPHFKQIHFAKNRGKGMALRQGFKTANALGFQYAVTIDSDGQHYPDDLPVFIREIERDGPALLIGARNMMHESVPKGSSFGNRFSNFWFWAETGIRLSDTQSGYRLYPLLPLTKMRFFSSRFEFEIEVIVKAAWRGISVKNVPIKVLYDPTERVSHFRPVWDFTRISLLNTWLVFVSLLYARPKKWLKSRFLTIFSD